ncbi:hypothetical protein N7489_010802 [Penicillium chrysogenum]|jgi:hypothetical protein|uniref:uncharacterized protein n=1 Tax=Penicillium chrysogenum TaxID=5076 RepID=UPI0024DF1237|nr:uncharacterized protein N7489_010802 [Penicillium chrysogenum]KAJ5230094.1 hypothetical protein N7489_010802 [Penicillium chrysogenum]KAJ6163680.1 hypothetical protein N7497_003659 [Penicillium chrysogenum]
MQQKGHLDEPKHLIVSSKSTPSTSWIEHFLFVLLIIPLTLSALVLYTDVSTWYLPDNLYAFVNTNRTSVQTAVQIVGAILAAIEVFALCRLINLTTRIRFTQAPVSLDMLGFWSALSTPTNNFCLPFWMIVIMVLLTNLSAIISALWTGALTPANAIGIQHSTVSIPDWSNISLIKEYPSEIDKNGLSIREAKGYFTYSVGMGLLGPLLSSMNSASPTDGGVRNHPKMDNTRYNYHGRSHGIGASAGLSDDNLVAIPHVRNYTFNEVGLDASVDCIYNTSSMFVLQDLPQPTLHTARGLLPDSKPSAPEYSVYVGRGDDAIVALGVAADPIEYSAKRYMAIAAGSYYKNLDKIQCAVAFKPAIFNVSVDIPGRNISVSRVRSVDAVHDIDPHHSITHIVMRQLELISNDLTSYYRSTLGDAFNASISDYRTSVAGGDDSLSEMQIVMKGMENAITSLVDDILGGYASAQLVVGGFKKSAPVRVEISTLRIGSRAYIIASAVITGLIALLVIGEGIRMRWWKDLPTFDYQDNRALVVGASRGGRGFAEYVEQMDCKDLGRIPVIWRKGKGQEAWDQGEIVFQPLLHDSEDDIERIASDRNSVAWI